LNVEEMGRKDWEWAAAAAEELDEWGARKDWLESRKEWLFGP
jgi:hypothetical protein